MVKLYVIIPVYNAINFLCEAVDSVLKQPYKDIDIVLVNDGSTDSSGALCDALAAENSRISVIHQANAGVSSARNAGIESVLERAGDTDYIAFLDADDLWFPNSISDDICSLVEETQSGLYSLGGIICNEDLTRFSHPYQHTRRQTFPGHQAIWKIPGPFCASLYSANLIKQRSIRFQNGLKYCEDKIFQHQCAFLAESVTFLPALWHICRNNSSSTMQRANSYSALDYLTPIINGWIQSDQFINSWESVTGKHCTAGYVLAGIYFMEMAASHYKRWGKRSEIEKVFREHPYYYLFEHMRPQDVSSAQYKDHNLLLKHPLLFQLKYNLIGALESLARLMLRLKPMADWWQKRKYPLTKLPAIHSAKEPL